MSSSAGGQVAFITGAARGFGLAFAEALVADGAAVVIADLDLEEAERAAAGIRDNGGSALAVACDVRDEVQVEKAVAESVSRFGDIGVLINNAGLHLTKYNQPFGTLTRDEVRAVFDVNCIGVVNCSLACRESMQRKGGGSIINIASIAGYMATSPYGVTKLAVRGLTIAFAKEFADINVRVNAIAPGLMGTPSALADLPPELVTQFTEELQYVHRMGEMDDIVAAMLFLTSPASSFITGETLRVSGGAALSIG